MKATLVELETSNSYLLLEYTRADRSKLIAIYKKLTKTSKGRSTILSRFRDMISQEKFEEYLDNSQIDYRVLILNSSNDIVGWGEYSVDLKKSAKFSRVIIPEYQKIGLGKQLARHLISQCKKRNPELWQIESSTTYENVLAIGSLKQLVREYSGWSTIDDKTQEIRFVFPL